MKSEMKKGASFTKAHKAALKKVGKSNDNQSGILKSKADYYYIDTGTKLYCIPLIKLFECVIFENIKPTKHNVSQGTYEMEMTGCIIPVETFAKYCIQIQPTLMKLN